MNVFWWAKTGTKPGIYTIGLGYVEVVVISAPNDALASQWAQCCANALNARERKLRDFGIDTVYNADGTVNEARSEAAQKARDRHEAMADDARDYNYSGE